MSVASELQPPCRATVTTLISRPHSALVKAGLCGNQLPSEAILHSETSKCVTFQHVTKRYIKFLTEFEYYEEIQYEIKTYVKLISRIKKCVKLLSGVEEYVEFL